MQTKDEFIERVIDEVTEGKSLPVAPKRKRVESIIRNARDYFIENDDESSEFEYVIVSADVRNTKLFKKKRQVKLPSCVEAVTEVREVGSFLNLFQETSPDYRKTNFNWHVAMLSADSGSMVLGVTAAYYQDFLRHYIVRSYRFDYNPHSNLLVIKGRDPEADIVLGAYVHISEESLFNMNKFFRYVVGKTRMSFARIYENFKGAKQIGGVEFNTQAMKQEGKEEVQEVKKEIRELRESTVNFFDEF